MKLLDRLSQAISSMGKESCTTGRIADRLTPEFRDQIYLQDKTKPFDLYKPAPGNTNHRQDTLLLHYQHGLGTSFGDGFSCLGYRINPDQNQVDILRGYQVEIPTQPILQSMNSAIKNHAVETIKNWDQRFFPYSVAHTYSLTNLPDPNRFIRDCESYRTLY